MISLGSLPKSNVGVGAHIVLAIGCSLEGNIEGTASWVNISSVVIGEEVKWSEEEGFEEVWS